MRLFLKIKRVLKYGSIMFAVLIGFSLAGTIINALSLLRLSNIGQNAHSQNMTGPTNAFPTVPRNFDECFLRSINEFETKFREYCKTAKGITNDDCKLNIKEMETIRSMQQYNSDKCYEEYPENR